MSSGSRGPVARGQRLRTSSGPRRRSPSRRRRDRYGGPRRRATVRMPAAEIFVERLLDDQPFETEALSIAPACVIGSVRLLLESPPDQWCLAGVGT